jgi:hypothetical protein
MISGGWREQRKAVWFGYSWNYVPLEVKTTSAAGSNDQIFFEVADSSKKHIARIVVRMSKDPFYFILHCQGNTPLKNLPEAPNNVRVWRFTRIGFKSISIMCNGVLVAEFAFAKTSKAECAGSGWTTSQVYFVKFNPDFDKTVGIRGMVIKIVGTKYERIFDCFERGVGF